MQDAWRAYLELATGLTEATRRRAEQAVRDLIGKGEATAAQVQGFADDLLSTSRANREALAKLVRYEVDRALGAVGLATSDEVTQLTERLRGVEQRLADLSGRVTAAEQATPSAAGATATATQPAKKATVRKTTAKKTTTKTTATRVTGSQSTVRRTTGRSPGTGRQQTRGGQDTQP